jgi:hypothetical protein
MAQLLAIIRAEHDDPPSQVGQAMHDADAAISHLIELRNDSATRDDMANEEAELWRLKSNLEWLLTSILLDKAKGELQAAE